jgi:hypothetical protein
MQDEDSDIEFGEQIPDIAVVGLQYNVAIVGSVDIASQVNFIYGFDLTVRQTFYFTLFDAITALTHS